MGSEKQLEELVNERDAITNVLTGESRKADLLRSAIRDLEAQKTALEGMVWEKAWLDPAPIRENVDAVVESPEDTLAAETNLPSAPLVAATDAKTWEKDMVVGVLLVMAATAAIQAFVHGRLGLTSAHGEPRDEPVRDSAGTFSRQNSASIDETSNTTSQSPPINQSIADMLLGDDARERTQSSKRRLGRLYAGNTADDFQKQIGEFVTDQCELMRSISEENINVEVDNLGVKPAAD